MVADVVFWIVAVVLVASAVAVVMLRDVFRAALLLVLSFFAVAGLYILLNADFLAAVQVLVYVGAIGILLMFAVMLTRNVQRGSPFSRISGPALVVALLIMATIVSVVVTTDWEAIDAQEYAQIAPQAVTVEVDSPTTGVIADALFDKENGFVLPFEIASVLLLGALIGAVVLVSRKEKE
jgi:NADH-quinone oxidoreductase subunit J